MLDKYLKISYKFVPFIEKKRVQLVVIAAFLFLIKKESGNKQECPHNPKQETNLDPFSANIHRYVALVHGKGASWKNLLKKEYEKMYYWRDAVIRIACSGEKVQNSKKMRVHLIDGPWLHIGPLPPPSLPI